MREQVIMPRAGRAGARGARRKSPGAKGPAWKKALAFLPLALKLALAVSLGVLVFVGYRTAASASFFKVRTVDVEGATRSSREDIRAAVLRLAGTGAWESDLEAISREVRELPWVRTAVVSRVLPSGLRVRVTEREPRVIARASSGRLVWVDDEGVALGAASPGDPDFFVRGIDEARTDEARRRNRERVSAALELARAWDVAGLTSRVSEVNLDDLRDVRVQLAGDDAHVEVRLGREDLVKRFRQALEVLDAQRQTPRGPFITYVDVSQGKRAVLGTGTTAHIRPASATAQEEPAPPPGVEAERGATPPPPGGAGTAVKRKKPETPPEPPKAKARQKKTAPVAKAKEQEKKKGATARQPGPAVRPRRVG